MNCNIFFTLLALLALSICHLIEVIVTQFQEWPDRPVILVSSCAPTLTATQHHAPGGVRKYPGERKVGVGAGGTFTSSSALMYFYSPYFSSQDQPGCLVGILVITQINFVSLSVRLSSS